MFISFRDMVDMMKQKDEKGEPVPFDVEVFTCNMNSNKHSRLMKLEGYVLAKLLKGTPAVLKSNNHGDIRRMGKHWKNRSMMLIHPKSKDYKRIYPTLVHSFNNMVMVYSL